MKVRFLKPAQSEVDDAVAWYNFQWTAPLQLDKICFRVTDGTLSPFKGERSLFSVYCLSLIILSTNLLLEKPLTR